MTIKEAERLRKTNAKNGTLLIRVNKHNKFTIEEISSISYYGAISSTKTKYRLKGYWQDEDRGLRLELERVNECLYDCERVLGGAQHSEIERLHRLMARPPAFHAGDLGSNPGGVK